MARLIAGADIVFGAPPRPCVSRRAHRRNSKIPRVTGTQVAGGRGLPVLRLRFCRIRHRQAHFARREGEISESADGSTATPVDSCGVQHESAATCPDLDGLECTLRDGDLRRWTAVDGLPADGMQEARSSNLRSSTCFPSSKPSLDHLECSKIA
jgi:hypothetical protein